MVSVSMKLFCRNVSVLLEDLLLGFIVSSEKSSIKIKVDSNTVFWLLPCCWCNVTWNVLYNELGFISKFQKH